MQLIFHIATEECWAEASRLGEYTAPSLGRQGFIHCSTASQVTDVANSNFRDDDELVLLCINQESLDVEVRYENLEGGTRLFPHVYGPIPCSCVVRVVSFPSSADGSFALPPEVTDCIQRGDAVLEPPRNE